MLQTDQTATVATLNEPLRLLPGTDLLGRVAGSGLREPPHYVRRPDGEVVQLSGLLFVIAGHARPGTTPEQIAQRAGADLDVRIRPDQVAYVLEHKLHPLGIVAGPDGAAPELKRLDPMLALSHRVGVVSPGLVDAFARPLATLFAWPVLAGVLAVLAAFDGWLIGVH